MRGTYSSAKNEYENEDTEGKIKLVYAYFGLAIYHGQCLEETFSIMLYSDRIFKNNINTNKEVNEIIDAIENSKKTMGNFIKEVKKSYNLTTSIVSQLDKILDKRNYLIHKYFKLHIQKSFSETGQLEMIKYFCEFIDKSKLLDEQLREYYVKYTESFGITEEKIKQLMVEMKEQELKRVIE